MLVDGKKETVDYSRLHTSLYSMGCIVDVFFSSMKECCCVFSPALAAGVEICGLVGSCTAAYILCQQRQQIMRHSLIPRNNFKEFLTSLCCYFCVLVQHERHVRSSSYTSTA
ncbi:unnamed protein product [Oikopleura dioica]|uniref:Uncharacterized protein n=1 Tax=Oikopleura dioica TaxID=34765 RepID=E4YJB1_OIKDI|nr:unnamed protein product [Oikopleura dioica]